MNEEDILYGVLPSNMPYGNSEHPIWEDLARFRSYKSAHRIYEKIKICKKDEELWKYEFRAGYNRYLAIENLLMYRKGYAYKPLEINKIVNYLLPYQREAWGIYRI